MFARTLIFAILIFSSIVSIQIVKAGLSTEPGMDIDEFIASAYTPTYDCPSAEVNTGIDKFLEGNTGAPDFELSTQQILQLTSMKTHGLICASKFAEAQAMVKKLLDNKDADRNAKYYASAIFQYGFVFDVQEKKEACEYYSLARDSAKDKYVDVHLSASMGYISECMNSRLDERLLSMYKLLESIAKMDNPAALAHAYNRVGYFYAVSGQPSLAAYQYKKAFDTAENIYTDENLVTLLGNLITALRASDDHEGTKRALEKFASINARSGTVQTKILYHVHLAGYYASIKDYKNLAIALESWEALGAGNKNIIYDGFKSWYNAVLCYSKGDLQCLRDYIESEADASDTYKNYFNSSKHYLKFLVDAHLMVQDLDGATLALEKYADKMQQIIRVTQNNNRALDLTSLHDKIINLEETLNEQKQTKNQVFWAAGIALFIILLIVLWCVRRKYIEHKSYDTATGVLTRKAVINKLAHLPKPRPQCTHALAIFDMANFIELNPSLIPMKGDDVLAKIAITFKGITRSSDLLGKFEPHQFILCLVDIEEEPAQAFFERAKQGLASTFAQHNKQNDIRVDSSMSIYYSAESFEDIDEILNNMVLSLNMQSEQ